MRIWLYGAGLVLTSLAASGRGLIYNLLMPTETVAAGTTVRLDLMILNPADEGMEYELPANLAGKIAAGGQDWPVELQMEANGSGLIAPHGFSHLTYTYIQPATPAGPVILEVEQPIRLRGVVEAGPVPALAGNSAVASTPLNDAVTAQPAATAVKRTYADRFSTHEPIYFIYGADRPGAKFQFSFKYRLLGDAAALGEAIPALRTLYFGYTQRSLWDITGDSSPFYDTSYMPELIYESQALVDPGKAGGVQWMGYQLAAKHESNGRAGPESRSVNTMYFRAALALGRLNGWHVLVIPRLFTYVSDLSNNPDIGRYRGNADLVVVLGRNDGPTLSLIGQVGRGGHKGSLEADLNIPLKSYRLFDFATYLMIQCWHGYGEDLLQYNQRTSSLRAGFSLVR